MLEKEFLINAIKSPRTIGSLFPSQRFLVQKMIKPISLTSANCIVEFGAGTGCITRKVLALLNPSCRFISFELNPSLAKALRQCCKHPHFLLVKDNAAKAHHYLRRQKLAEVDYLISSLPLANMTKKQRIKVLSSAARILKKGGLFIQFQYLPLNFYEIKKYFPKIDVHFVPLNLPPAFVYYCRS